MADKKFTDLSPVVLLTGNEVIPSVQAGVDLYTTPDQITSDVVKTDIDIADAISKKHTQGTDQGLDTGGANAVTVADVKDAVTKKHAAYSDAETAASIIALGIDEIEFSVIKAYMI